MKPKVVLDDDQLVFLTTMVVEAHAKGLRDAFAVMTHIFSRLDLSNESKPALDEIIASSTKFLTEENMKNFMEAMSTLKTMSRIDMRTVGHA